MKVGRLVLLIAVVVFLGATPRRDVLTIPRPGITSHRDHRHPRADLLPLLLKENVDLNICGHDHDAELIGKLKARDGQPVFLVAGRRRTLRSDGGAASPGRAAEVIAAVTRTR